MPTLTRAFRGHRPLTYVSLGLGIVIIVLVAAANAFWSGSGVDVAASPQLSTRTGMSGDLFERRLSIQAPRDLREGATLVLFADICGQTMPAEGCPPKDAHRFGQPVPRATPGAKVTGRIRAELAASSPDIKIKPVGPAVQPAVGGADWETWAWGVSATRPGTFQLVASFTMVPATSEEATQPTRFYSIDFTIRRSTTGVAARAWRRVSDATGPLTGLAGLLTALGVTSFLADRLLGRRAARREREEAHEEAG
jgi:hypothetical protein